MIAIRAAKVALVAAVALFASLVSYGNPATTANKLTDRWPLFCVLIASAKLSRVSAQEATIASSFERAFSSASRSASSRWFWSLASASTKAASLAT